MPNIPPEDDDAKPTDKDGSARADIERPEGSEARAADGANADDHGDFLVAWAVDETAKMYRHLDKRNSELREFIQRVGVHASLKVRIDVRRFNERCHRVIERIGHFEIHGTIPDLTNETGDTE